MTSPRGQPSSYLLGCDLAAPGVAGQVGQRLAPDRRRASNLCGSGTYGLVTVVPAPRQWGDHFDCTDPTAGIRRAYRSPASLATAIAPADR